MEVKHYTNTLFCFTTKKLKTFKFKPGEYTTIGLIIRGMLVFRDYYICSPKWDNKLEFYSRGVPNGLFTSFLRMVTTKSSIIIKKKTSGELILDVLSPGKRLFLLCSDIGIAAVSSIISEPNTYAKFDEVIVVIVCEYVCELQYFSDKMKQMTKDQRIKPYIKNKLRVYQSVTHEPYPYSGNLTWLIKSGTLIADLRTYNFNKMDRFMVCGSNQTTLDSINLLKSLGYSKGSIGYPAHFTYEGIFVDQTLKLLTDFDVLLKWLKIKHPDKDTETLLNSNRSISSSLQLFFGY
ncbi:Ferredoxin--NADP reductase [Candidatus Hodgkinia cicadicola]|uniref:Ferredoxin--NADP reductase n=1 Tax=Candidatus Hodgkinia cicadicola TaxID=573658 RepID=A0ABX4MIS4_9HYPH|nr:Ferredoxin--NADP reductase [Candidatus Hodgkinia cicadicola]PIM95431.1 Ferredoxin--NADP reductase [Candidatus Hodgkinia cicadicola]